MLAPARGKGEGKIATQIHAMVRLARHNYFKDKKFPVLNTELHEQYKTGQLSLF